LPRLEIFSNFSEHRFFCIPGLTRSVTYPVRLSSGLKSSLMFDQIKAYYQKKIPAMQEEDWNRLKEHLTVQHLKKGEFLTRNGDICRHVSFINKGLLRMFYLVEGKEVCTASWRKTNTSLLTIVS
jgi:CRP-like cAMP-binding protein